MLPRRPPVTIAFCAWTVLVWTTRIGILWGDDSLTTGEKWGRSVLALTFTALVVVVLDAVLRSRSWRSPAVKTLAIWTVGVWVVRSYGIATGDHEAGFIVVHLVLGIASVILAVLALREDAREARTVQPA